MYLNLFSLSKKLFSLVFLLAGLCIYSQGVLAQKQSVKDAQQLEQKAAEKAANQQKSQAAGFYKQAAEKYLEAAETQFIKQEWAFLKKALENFKKAANLYAQCGTKSKEIDSHIFRLERQIFEIERDYAHSLPIPKTTKGDLPKETNKTPEVKKPEPNKPKIAPKGSRGRGRNTRNGSTPNSNQGEKNVPKPPVPVKPGCEEGKTQKKILYKEVFQIPHPNLDMQIKAVSGSGRGKYSKGIAGLGDYLRAVANIIGAGEGMVSKLSGGLIVATIPMKYFQGILQGAGSIIKKAESIQGELEEKSTFDLTINIPYKEIEVRCVKTRTCTNGQVIEKIVFQERETDKSRKKQTRTYFHYKDLFKAKANKLIAEIVPREVKNLMENQKRYETTKKKGCQ
ncbi:MAG: hypothetical protein ACPG49_07115 [Chitinophagales bacterium]